MNKYKIIGVAALLVLLVGGFFLSQKMKVHPLPIDAKDTLTNWGIPGVTVTTESTARADEEIEKLTALLGNEAGEPTDYAIYVGVAQQYERMGDGKKAYEYIGKAIAIDPEKTGLGWHNLGALLARLGAHHTARIAYDRAVEAQPNIEQYHFARLEFLTSHFSDDTDALVAAFAAGETQFKNPAGIFQLKAAWLTKIGKPAEAISAWEKVKALLPGENAAIDAEIAKLKRAL